MPNLDGPEIFRRLRACGTDLPWYLILLTVRGSKEDISEGLGAGADYLAKPFVPREPGAGIDVGSRIVALQEHLAGKVEELELALHQLRTLRGIVPICATCKKTAMTLAIGIKLRLT
jgi:phosphoserine phosphatase RsbU/P